MGDQSVQLRIFPVVEQPENNKQAAESSIDHCKKVVEIEHRILKRIFCD